jgi:hypothetical protein
MEECTGLEKYIYLVFFHVLNKIISSERKPIKRKDLINIKNVLG